MMIGNRLPTPLSIVLLVTYVWSCASSEKSNSSKTEEGGSTQVSVRTPEPKTSQSQGSFRSEVNQAVVDTEPLKPEPFPAQTKAESHDFNDLIMFLKKQQLGQAKEFCFLHLEKTGGKSWECWHALGLMALQEGKISLAKYYLNQAKEANAPQHLILNSSGLIYIKKEDWAAAIQSFRSSVQSKSNMAAQVNVAMVYLKFKQWAKARGVTNLFEANSIQSIELLNNLGIVAALGNDLNKAKKYFERAYKLNPNHLLTLTNYSIFAVELLGDYDLGRKLLDQWAFLGVESSERPLVDRLNKSLERLKK